MLDHTIADAHRHARFEHRAGSSECIEDRLEPGRFAHHSRRCELERANGRDARHRRRIGRGKVDATRDIGRAGRSKHRHACRLQASDMTGLDEDGRAAVRGKHVGFVFQSFHLIPSLTAIENVMLPLELAARRDARQVARGRPRSGGADASRYALPQAIVGGRAATCGDRACLRDSSCRVVRGRAHGQFGHRDGQRITDLLFELNRSMRSTLILVTHDRTLAARCGRVLELDAGHPVG